MALATLLLGGCALTPEQIKTVSVAQLCGAYSAPMSPDLLNPEIKQELINRGAVHCTTPEYLQMQAAALQGLGTSMHLLQQGQRRPITPAATQPVFTQPLRCTSQYNPISRTTQTICN
jgi:hypothetical protein